MTNFRRVLLSISLVLSATLTFTACSADSSDSSGSGDSGADPNANSTEPTTDALETARWILGQINAETPASAEEWQTRLSEDFLAELSAAELLQVVNLGVRPAAPFEETGFERAASPEQASPAMGTEYMEVFDQASLEVTASDGTVLQIQVAVNSDGLISGLFFVPGELYEHDQAESIAEVGERLENIASDVQIRVVRSDASAATKGSGAPKDATPDETLLSLGNAAPAPLASVFKLYVLGALGQAAQAGNISWDDKLTLTDGVKSLPSGELQDAESGSEYTVLETAKLMISISDNTATDMLIAALGRERVEQAVTEMGHHDPEAITPFLTTQEAFTLLWGGHDDLNKQWAEGSESQQREVLQQLAAEDFQITLDDVETVVGWPRGVDWFASADDVVAAHKFLADLSADQPEIRDILSVNPGQGLDLQNGQWDYLGFKGGSSVGVYTLSWIAELDSTSYFIAVLLADTDPAVLDQHLTEIAKLSEDLFRLLLEEA